MECLVGYGQNVILYGDICLKSKIQMIDINNCHHIFHIMKQLLHNFQFLLQITLLFTVLIFVWKSPNQGDQCFIFDHAINW